MICFSNEPPEDEHELFLATIKSPVLSKNDLLFKLSSELKFPNYFGNNWDAAFDIMIDMNWIEEKRICIFHESMDDLPLGEFIKYISVIVDISRSYDEMKAKDFRAIFPKNLEKIVSSMELP